MKSKINKKILNYTAIIEKNEAGGFWAYVPSLQGCYSQGETLDQVTKNIKEAIELYTESANTRKQITRVSSPFAIIQVPVFG